MYILKALSKTSSDMKPRLAIKRNLWYVHFGNCSVFSWPQWIFFKIFLLLMKKHKWPHWVDTYWNQYKMLPECILTFQNSIIHSLRRKFSWIIYFFFLAREAKTPVLTWAPKLSFRVILFQNKTQKSVS